MMKNNYRDRQKRAGNFNLFYISVAVLIVFSSCTVTKQSAYFKTLQKDTTLKNFVSNDFESKIIKGDRLSVTASSTSPVEDALFNAAPTGGASAGAVSGVAAGGYIVQEDGSVYLHRIGKMQAEGLTRKEFAQKTEEKLLAFMKEPIVQVSYLNHKITVLGEVVKPQVLPMTEEQLPLIDVLVMSGDLTPNARRTAVTIIREEGNTKKVKHVNLEDHSLFSSPWYYVRANDIILVSSDSEKYVKEERRRKLQTTLSLVASGISLLIIILDRVIKKNTP